MAKSNKTALINNESGITSFEINPIKSTSVGTYYMSDTEYIYYGENNLFPQKLIALADNSSIHNALLQTLTRWISGDGIIIEDGNVSEKQIIDLFGDEDYLTRISYDLAMFGGWYDNVIWNNGGKVSKIYHKDFSTVRAGKINLESKRIENYFISLDWAKSTYLRDYSGENALYKPLQIPTFDIKTFRKSKDGQIKQVKSYKAGKNNLYYSEPAYIAALRYIDIAAKIAELHDSNISNGMMPSYHVHLFQDLSDEKKRLKVEKGLINKFGGSGNAGKIVLTWSTDVTALPKLEPLQINDVHEMYNMMSDKVNAEIIAAHRVPTFLANIILRAGFTDVSTAMRQSISFFQSSVIQPLQRMITNNIESYLKINGIDAKLNISNLNPVAMFGDVNVMREVMTANEYRDIVLGMDKVDGMDVLITQIKPKT